MTDNIYVPARDLKANKDTKLDKRKEQPVELQGGFKKLKTPMFGGESEEVAEAWLLNIKRCF